MATVKYLRQVSGDLAEAVTVETSAGAADGSKVPNTRADGVIDPTLLNATATSVGAASGGKVILLDSSGKLDQSTLPVGLGADTITMTASEALTAGAYVNVHNSTGAKVRNADAATGRRAMGFVLTAIASGAAGLVYFEGTNTAVTGRTPGAVQFLGAAGASTETAPTAANSIVQQLGTAVSATAVSFEPHLPILLA